MTPLEHIIAAVLERAAQTCADWEPMEKLLPFCTDYSNACALTGQHEAAERLSNAIRSLPVADLAKELAHLVPGEPVAWGESYDGGKFFNTVSTTQTKHHRYPLYAHPSDAESLRAEVERLTAELADWKASQHYRYIGRDGKPVLARELEERAEKAEAELTAVLAQVKKLDAIDRSFVALIFDAVAEADRAMKKFPQPNYVISKFAEESGEVVKAAIHCAEGRETFDNVRSEVKQAVAMLYRLWVEGDQVHGLVALKSSA